VARTGLRMMPTFPPLPLKSRTAGFPQYGFKVGISDGPSCQLRVRRVAVCIRPSCTSLPIALTAVQSPGSRCADAPPFKRLMPLYPRGPRSGPGYSVPVHHHLAGPMRPTHRHSSISPQSGLYALPSLCARLQRLGDPRVVPCFRWPAVSTCRPLRPREAHRLHSSSFFTDGAGL
jgi:hypothetical protein